MAGSGTGGGIGGPNGQTQNINGVQYTMYTPAWYQAMQEETQRQAAAKGTAAGTTLSAAAKAAGVPLAGSGSTSTAGSGASTGSGSITSQPTVPPPSIAGLNAAVPGGGGSTHSHIADVDTSAAEAASFNKAKDQVGLESSGALAGLRSALGGRGMLGSGLEERGTASLASSAAGNLADVSRQQAVTRADEAQKNAETNFQGDITQRGQDFQKEEAGNSLAGSLAMAGASNAVTQRGQDISDRNAQKALELEQAQLGAQQRSTALAGLEAALKVSTPGGMMY